MASEHLLSSLAAYAAVVGIPFALLALALTEPGRAAARNARTTLRPSEGKCEMRLWADLDPDDLHVCTSRWQANCHQKFHSRGPRCWERSLTMIINHWNPKALEQTVDKPKSLPLSKEFIHVDLKVVLAFVFMAAIKGASPPADDQTEIRRFRVCGAELDIQTIEPELVVLHVQGTLQTEFTKDYIDRLLRGYPPLLRDPENVSVFTAGDEARGGWVAALGLELDYDNDKTFLPVYSDHVRYKDRRGHLFWRSMDRVRFIITDIWAKVFAGDPKASKDIATTIRALEYIYTHETESGVEQIFDVTMPSRPLTPEETTRIIRHFNGPPLIAGSQEQQFHAEWKNLLHYVLVAAVRGSVRCIAYFKNPGRELQNILPMEVLKSAKLYLRGC